MRLWMTALGLALLPVAAAADGWRSGFGQGVCESWVDLGPGNRIMVTCDCGAGSPVSAVHLSLLGRAPAPGSTVQVTFDGDVPTEIGIDRNGVIGSDCRVCADSFDWLLERMRTHRRVHIRYDDGLSAQFSLDGAAGAIGECVSDFARQ